MGTKLLLYKLKNGALPRFLHHARYSANFDNCDTANKFSQALTAGPGGVADGLTVGGEQNSGTVDITECYLPSAQVHGYMTINVITVIKTFIRFKNKFK